MPAPVQPGANGDAHEAAVRLTSDQVSAINRFPDDNPNPVLRVDGDGHLLYANPASAPILRSLDLVVGDPLPADLLGRFEDVAPTRGSVEIVADHRTYAVLPVEIPDLGFTNLYGMDVTAEKAIVKFPAKNPNPVLRIRWDGALIYANPASDALIAGLGVEVGDRLADELCARLFDEVRAEPPRPVEVVSGPCTFELTPVDVPEFGFINVYGTDITATKDLERLARENERLLLNILPEPIAARLRLGEPLIADRFDDVTMMFADIVEFTRLSSTMSPSELVGVLNEVFSAFDVLVDAYGLEKVKTIGDAYMVVGGMPERSDDHTVRVAAMALELAAAVADIDAAVRLGIQFRIGIHCGPVVAGVIGTKKFIYDVWGDTVNLASRMEAHGMAGRVQVTHAVKERVEETFEVEPRGLVDIKGKGPMPTWFLVGAKSAATRDGSPAVGTGGVAG